MGGSVKKDFTDSQNLDHCGVAKDFADQLPEQTVRFCFGQVKVFAPNRW
jgi:hypothetical protein